MSRSVLLRVLAITLLLPWSINTAVAQSGGTSDTHNSSDVLLVRLLYGRGELARETIQWAILDLALQKSGRAYDLDTSVHTLAPGRAVSQLENLGDEANLIWGSVAEQLKEELLPVGVPIFRGLLSYFHIWVREEDRHRFSDIRTLDALKELSILQDPNWRTKDTFECEGFDVRVGNLPNLPEMLSRSRADALFFPVMETAKLNGLGAQSLNLIPLPNVIVYLPIEHYFFVPREGQKQLHDALFAGMNAAIADGSYEKLISAHPATRMAFSELLHNNAVQIDIENCECSNAVLDVDESYQMKLTR